MTSNYRCPRCQAVNGWPEYVSGKTVTCPACGQRFAAIGPVGAVEGSIEPVVVAESAEPVPVLELAPMVVVPVDESEPPPARSVGRRKEGRRGPDGDWSQSVRDLCERRDLQHLDEPRRIVFALLVAALEDLRPRLVVSLVTIGLIPIVLLIAFGIGIGIMLGIWGVALALDSAGISAGYLALYLPPGFVVLTAYYSKKTVKTEPIILGRDDQGKIDRFKLGRLDGIFRLNAPATSVFFLGVLLAMQLGLLYFTPDHLGIARERTLVECLLLTCDNLLHGVLFDICELFEINLAHKVEHTGWTASVFWCFRFSYEAFALIAAYQAWRHYTMRRLFRGLPSHWRNVDFVLNWIEDASRREGDWAREFLDEFLFLILSGAYLSGDVEMIRDIDRRFPWLRISEEVRKLFVDSDGHRLFEYQPEPA